MKPINLDIDDYHKAVEIFHGETDRAAAVLAGSFIENYLANYLRSFMIEDKELDKLFDGLGPFSGYAQRFETAYAFGFISAQQRHDLRFVGKIRNHFAHHPLEAGFEKEPVSNWCAQLSTCAIYPLAGQEVNLRQDNRNRYLVVVSLSVLNWHNSMLKRASGKSA